MEEQGASFEFPWLGFFSRSTSGLADAGGGKSKKNRRLSSLIKERCKRSSGLYGMKTRARGAAAEEEEKSVKFRGSWRLRARIYRGYRYRAASSMQLIKFRMYVCRALGSKRVPARKLLVLGSTPPSSFRHACEQCAETAEYDRSRSSNPLPFRPSAITPVIAMRPTNR